jgi:tetratricopeptide (TPR) repeat protein
MKYTMKILVTIIGVIYNSFSFGQKLETVKVAGPELYKLNSTMRADLGGMCRLYVPLNIPLDALYCYVTISTASGNEWQQIQNGVNLFMQVSSRIPSVTAQSVSVLASLSESILGVSKGSVADVSFMQSFNDAELFRSGRGSYQHMPQYSRSNYNGGTISIPVHNFRGQTIYVGLANNNAVNAAWVNIEAVAVIYKEEKVAPTPEAVSAVNYANLGWQSYKNGNIDKCIAYSQKALTYDSTTAVAMLNLGLCYLVKNNEPEAILYYMNALRILKQKNEEALEYYLREAIKDIKNARKKQPAMAEGQDIISLFKETIKQH